MREKELTINGVKKILNQSGSHSLDDLTNFGVYKPSSKTTKVIKNKLRNITKIIKDLKNLKNG